MMFLLTLSTALAGWSVHIDRDAMSDEETRMAVSYDSLMGPMPEAGLFSVICTAGSPIPNVGIWSAPKLAWIDSIGSGQAYARLRVDDADPVELPLLNTSLDTALFSLTPELLDSLASGSKLLLEFPIVNNGRQVYTFTLEGSREALEGVGCPLTPEVTP